MSEQSDSGIGGPDLQHARLIDAVCRSFEADWRAGKQPRVSDYLTEVPQAARTILRSELEALECELRQLDEEPRSSHRCLRPQGQHPSLRPPSQTCWSQTRNCQRFIRTPRFRLYATRRSISPTHLTKSPRPHCRGAAADCRGD